MLALAPAAGAAKKKTVKLAPTGATTLALDDGAAAALQSLGIAVAPLKPARAGDAGIAFPITAGKLDRQDVRREDQAFRRPLAHARVDPRGPAELHHQRRQGPGPDRPRRRRARLDPGPRPLRRGDHAKGRKLTIAGVKATLTEDRGGRAQRRLRRPTPSRRASRSAPPRSPAALPSAANRGAHQARARGALRCIARAPVAQWIERCPPEAEVGGSNPSRRASASCHAARHRLRHAPPAREPRAARRTAWSGCRRRRDPARRRPDGALRAGGARGARAAGARGARQRRLGRAAGAAAAGADGRGRRRADRDDPRRRAGRPAGWRGCAAASRTPTRSSSATRTSRCTRSATASRSSTRARRPSAAARRGTRWGSRRSRTAAWRFELVALD